jgi:hypothetical protein
MIAGFDRTDFSVVAKNRSRLPKPWRWEIYRAGRQKPGRAFAGIFRSAQRGDCGGPCGARPADEEAQILTRRRL